MNKPKLVIFDCDGVITETAHLHYQAWNKITYEYFNFELDSSYLNKFRGLSREDSLNLILNKAKELGKDIDNLDHELMINNKNEFYKEMIKNKENINLLPGILNFIKELRNQNILTAVASTSRNSKNILELLEIDVFFDYLVDPNSLSKQKPDPEIFLKAAEYFKINSNECWGIEDAYVGIEAINSANMFSVGIGKKEEVGKANLIFKSTEYINYKEILDVYNHK